MHRRTFIIFNVLGACLWVIGITLIGYLLAGVIGTSIDAYVLPIVGVIVVLSLIPPLLEWRRTKNR